MDREDVEKAVEYKEATGKEPPKVRIVPLSKVIRRKHEGNPVH